MLEIVRGRTYELIQTFLEHFDGPASDMTHIVGTKCEIRTKADNLLICAVTVVLNGFKNSVMTLSLTREQTEALEVGEYKIDAVGYDADDKDESLLDPEAIKVVNRPSVL